MTKRLLVFCVILQTLLSAQTAPNLVVTDLEGTSHNLYEYLDQGKTVVLDFFIVNCTSCEEGAPFLDEFWSINGPNGNDQLQIISLEISNASDQMVAEIGQNWNINNPLVNLADAPDLYDSFIMGFPTYIVLCPDRSMTTVLDFNFPETILAWEQNINFCEFGTNFTDVNIFANEIIYCQENAAVNLVIGNVGSNEIFELTIDVFVDSIYHSNIQWNHFLQPNMNTNSTPFPIDFYSDNINGEILEFRVHTPGDINQNNNTVSHEINQGISTTNTELMLRIEMDNYPDDLVWLITNDAQEVILEGIGLDYSPYQEIDIPVVLELNNCYTFTILDSMGDGLCCSFGEGSFNLVSNQDTLIYNTPFESNFSASFYVGNPVGLKETISTNKRIVNKQYFNIMGQLINYPTKSGIYLEKSIYEDGSFYTEKILFTNTLN